MLENMKVQCQILKLSVFNYKILLLRHAPESIIMCATVVDYIIQESTTFLRSYFKVSPYPNVETVHVHVVSFSGRVDISIVENISSNIHISKE